MITTLGNTSPSLELDLETLEVSPCLLDLDEGLQMKFTNNINT